MMRAKIFCWLAAILLVPSLRAASAPGADANWFQLQTPNFMIFSSGRPDLTSKAALQLEQFRDAYSRLAGPKAVMSLPILVYAFPDDAAFRPFQPVYQGKAVPVGGYFQRGLDQNVIALNLAVIESGSMEVIFHEYMHLLMRHNEDIWPVWLHEGMAEVYSTFENNGARVCLGVAKQRHIDLLKKQPLMPLEELFRVDQKSSQYNEREQRGVFYSQSWALTHYIVLGGSAARKAQYGVFNRKLREGLAAADAFTQAFQTTLPAMQKELEGYLARGRFEPLCYPLNGATDISKSFVQRPLPRVETLYQLGGLLMHTRRLDEAGAYFREARAVAPDSLRPLEGLGLLAARQDREAEARDLLGQAVARQSSNYRVHFEYGRLLHDQVEEAGDNASEATLNKALNSLRLATQRAPLLAPAHYILGIAEMNRGKDMFAANKHVRAALDLEPGNLAYQLALGHLQAKRGEAAAARQTLKPLLGLKTPPELRRQAEGLMQSLNAAPAGRK